MMAKSNQRDKRNNSTERVPNQRREIHQDVNPIAELLSSTKQDDQSDKFVYVLGKRTSKDNESLVAFDDLNEHDDKEGKMHDEHVKYAADGRESGTKSVF
jgi:hypothetical protein